MSSSTPETLTLAQKAAAFDELCNKCDVPGAVIDYVERKSISGSSVSVSYTPRYQYILMYEGRCPTFKHALIAMASKLKG